MREYWLVNADAAYVMVYRLETNERFAKPDYYRRDEKVRSDVLGGAAIPVAGFVREGNSPR